MSAQLRIREATRADVAPIFSLIAGLAAYERAPEQVTGTEELLAQALFGAQPAAEALIAELGSDPDAQAGTRAAGAGTTAGFALFFPTFSTWECRPGIWLEDLYVVPEHRRGGVGKALMTHLGALALQRGCARLEWSALDWNTPALEFYEQLGARRLEKWRMHRLDGEALARVARMVGRQDLGR
ncbi:MAG: GNAT family N-acetyltransferase [Solirubrobacteraceae bacterium]